MASLPEEKTQNDESLACPFMQLSVSSTKNPPNNQQLQLQMQQAAIGELQFGVLDQTKNGTKAIRHYKQSQPKLQAVMNELKVDIEKYEQSATTDLSQSSAYNLKSAVITGVNAVNGLMASAVMNAELASTQASQTYMMASKLLEQSLSGVVQTSVNAAMYNQMNLLRELKEEKAIQSDQQSMKCIQHIEEVDTVMRKRGKRGMAAGEIAEQANKAHQNYQKLAERASVQQLPETKQQKIKDKGQAWKIVAGLAAVVAIVAIGAGIAALVYYGGGTALV